MAGLSSLFWLGLAVVFAVLAITSTKHYLDFRENFDKARYHNIRHKVTSEYKKSVEAIELKTESGLQRKLLVDLIPLESIGFIVAMIGAVLTYYGL